jgi:hypothetical protein
MLNLTPIMNIPCIKCKGANPRETCGRTFCPIIAKGEALFRMKKGIQSENFMSSSPAPFVGHNFYPNLYVGILSPSEKKDDAWLYDAPNYWAEKNFQIPQIVDYRSALINSRFRLNVKQRNRFLDISQEVGMASKPVELELNLKEKPKFHLTTDPYHAPMGPNARLEKAKITSNPKIDTRVDKVVSDADFKANSALTYLYDRGFDENFLTKILSTGNLGLKPQRKLVPTRWSITATDDALAKHLLKEVKEHRRVEFEAYFGGYLGNYFLILFFPEVWSYELFETYAPKAEWNISNSYQYMTDYESYEGRKTYAENCGGGYYASRLAVLEKLREKKRQASVLILRFITGEYAVPLGVWEAVRKTMAARSIEFSSKELMLKYVISLVRKKFNYNAEILLKESILLKEQRTQRKIVSYLK